MVRRRHPVTSALLAAKHAVCNSVVTQWGCIYRATWCNPRAAAAAAAHPSHSQHPPLPAARAHAQQAPPSPQGSGAMASSGSGPAPTGSLGGGEGVEASDADMPMAESPVAEGHQQPGAPIVVQVSVTQ